MISRRREEARRDKLVTELFDDESLIGDLLGAKMTRFKYFSKLGADFMFR
jgi:hypothetical protein